jgi:hypothetical protein
VTLKPFLLLFLGSRQWGKTALKPIRKIIITPSEGDTQEFNLIGLTIIIVGGRRLKILANVGVGATAAVVVFGSALLVFEHNDDFN